MIVRDDYDTCSTHQLSNLITGVLEALADNNHVHAGEGKWLLNHTQITSKKQ